MAGDGSRVRVGMRRSADGRGIAPTTTMPTASYAHVAGFSDLCINLDTFPAPHADEDVATIPFQSEPVSTGSTGPRRRGRSSSDRR